MNIWTGLACSLYPEILTKCVLYNETPLYTEKMAILLLRHAEDESLFSIHMGPLCTERGTLYRRTGMNCAV